MALLAVFAAIGIITATGAFTSVTADRTATVNVQGDQAANLQLEPYEGPNGIGDGKTVPGDLGSSDGYADITDGTLVINLGGFNNGNAQGLGVNYNATTKFDYVFNVTNNANNSVAVTITPNGDHSDKIAIHAGDTDASNTSAQSFNLNSGETQPISITVDLTNFDSSDLSEGSSLIDSFTIEAVDNS